MMAVLAVADEGEARRVGLVAHGHLLAPARLVAQGPEAVFARALASTAAEAKDLGHRLVGAAMASSPGRTPPAADLRRLGLPILRVRRAEAVREAEWADGTLSGARHVLVLDSDGPDAALVLDGRACAGASGRAGTVAHLGLDRSGPVTCSCGRRGCLGALLAAGEDAPPPPRPAGCGPAHTRALGWLTLAGIALVNAVNPEFVVVAGSIVADAADLENFATTLMSGCLSATAAGLSAVVMAETDAPLIGAASLFLAGSSRGAPPPFEET